MGGKNAPLHPEESIRGVLKVLADFDPEKHNGNFIDHEGNSFQWWTERSLKEIIPLITKNILLKFKYIQILTVCVQLMIEIQSNFINLTTKDFQIQYNVEPISNPWNKKLRSPKYIYWNRKLQNT